MSIPSDSTISFELNHNLICIIDSIDADLASLKWSVSRQKNGRYAIVRTKRAGTTNDVSLPRTILERVIGRKIQSNEFCKYIDGNSLNNCRANLQLKTTGLPKEKKYYEPDYTPRKKQCTKCKKYKQVKEFPINRQIKGGIHSWCKECTNRISNNYNHTHPEKKIAYRENNREKLRLDTVKRRLENPERNKEIQRKSALRRADYIKAYQISYSEAHPEIRRVNSLKHKARKRALPIDFTSDDWRNALQYFKDVCAYCGNPPSMFDLNKVLHADHFIPVADPNCPGTVKTNMLPACQNCNLNKQDKDPHIWLIERFGKHKARKIEKRIQEYFNSL